MASVSRAGGSSYTSSLYNMYSTNNLASGGKLPCGTSLISPCSVTQPLVVVFIILANCWDNVPRQQISQRLQTLNCLKIKFSNTYTLRI